MKIIDLYCGIGGGSEGLRNAGYEPAFACDASRYARFVYRKNFSCYVDDDVASIDPKKVPHPEIVFASPDTLDSKPIIRILEATSPRAVIIEYPERMFDKDLRDRLVNSPKPIKLGSYKCWGNVASTEDYGLPQKRKRFYLVGFRSDVKMITDRFTFPEPTTVGDKRNVLGNILEPDPKPNLYLTKRKLEYIEMFNQRNEDRDFRFKHIAYGANDITQSLAMFYYKDYRGILVDVGKGVRRLSVLECRRLMGFKDSFNLPVSQKKSYELLAIASCPPVVQAIGQELSLWLI